MSAKKHAEPALGMLLKGYPRISETFISNEIAALEARGFRVVILSMRQPREHFAHTSISRIQAPVVYLPTELFSAMLRGLPALFMLMLTRRTHFGTAVDLLRTRMKSSKRPHITLKHFFQAAYAANAVIKHGVGHLHAHFAHSPTSVASFAAAFTGLRYSFTGHAKDVWTQEPVKLVPKLAKAKFIITCTSANKAYLSTLAAQSGTPVDRVYHGIDLSLFQYEPRLDPPEEPYQILSVARLTPKKGIDTVLKALAKMRTDGVDFQYTVIGTGEDDAALEALAQKLGISKRVKFLGVQPHHVVLEHLYQADAFVLGCRVLENGDRDGVPNVLVEAMACGVPVVATNVSAIPELVTQGRTGMLVAPDDPEALSYNLRRILTEGNLRAEIIPSARQVVEKTFDVEKNADVLANLFRRRLGW